MTDVPSGDHEMSQQGFRTPQVRDAADRGAVEQVIVPRARDLGGFEVRRALPAATRQMVGPFIFFDQMGPVEFLTGQGIDVRPHPHIGLATVTYLFQGKMHHRDSLGTDQWIEAGDVNLMTAGHGITHSERTDGAVRAAPHSMAGIQTWLALPEAQEEDRPAFEHAPVSCLPYLKEQIKLLRPKVIVCLGATAVKGLFDTRTGITKLRGNWMTFENIDVMPTFHPAYLLRNPAGKKDVWEDMQEVLRRLPLETEDDWGDPEDFMLRARPDEG